MSKRPFALSRKRVANLLKRFIRTTEPSVRHAGELVFVLGGIIMCAWPFMQTQQFSLSLALLGGTLKLLEELRKASL